MFADAAAGSESEPSGARVLVVDDDEKICRQLAAGLASAGHQVVTAHDGTGSIAALQGYLYARPTREIVTYESLKL